MKDKELHFYMNFAFILGFIVGLFFGMLLYPKVVNAQEPQNEVQDKIQTVVFVMAACQPTMIDNGYSTFKVYASAFVSPLTLDSWYNAARAEYDKLPHLQRIGKFSPLTCRTLTTKYINDASLAIMQQRR